MDMTWSQAAGVLFALAVVVGYLWVLITPQADTSPTRLAQMLNRLGFGSTDFNQWQIELYMPTAARTCRECGSKAECDAWLATNRKAAAPPPFCPNANVRHLAAVIPQTRAE